jgi:hypothetical protein
MASVTAVPVTVMVPVASMSVMVAMVMVPVVVMTAVPANEPAVTARAAAPADAVAPGVTAPSTGRAHAGHRLHRRVCARPDISAYRTRQRRQRAGDT